MPKSLTLSLVSLLMAGTVAALAIPAPAHAGGAVVCTDDLVCVPVNDPGDPDPDPGHTGPGSPGDPYIPPEFFTADVVKNMLIACRVSGTPQAQPNDLRFRNIGDLTIPAGTRVSWQVKESGEHGYFTLPSDLPVGESAKDEDVLEAGLPTADHCYSKIV